MKLLLLHLPCQSLCLFTFTKPKPYYYYSPPHLSFSTPRRRRSSRRSRRSPWSHNHQDSQNNNTTLKRTIEFDSSSDNPNIKLLLNFDQISPFSSIDRFVSFSNDAYQDLIQSVQIDTQARTFRLSCRKSSLQFLAAVVVSGFFIALAFRVFIKLSLAIKAQFSPKPKVIVRRDRSLGGKEVIVSTDRDLGRSRSTNFNALDNPLSLSSSSNSAVASKIHSSRIQGSDKLPKWWPKPVSVSKNASVFDNEYYQNNANRLVREIIDKRLGGKDFAEEDIIQLRQICRTSGVSVSFDTNNTGDSLYRASIELVLNVCCRASGLSTDIQIDDEDSRYFLAGLAENIGLDNIRASRMVSAGVAARTRFCFLQAWAFEMQGKHREAASELTKMCLIHGIFPPGESSPEMEMVKRGLEKILKVEQRELLMAMVVGNCNGSEEIRRSAAEALGVVC